MMIQGGDDAKEGKTEGGKESKEMKEKEANAKKGKEEEAIQKQEKDYEILKEGEIDLNPRGPKRHLCRLCRLPKAMGSQQVRPGLRGCVCHDPCPYYRLPDDDEFIYQFIHGPNPPNLTKIADSIIPPYMKKLCLPPHPKTLVKQHLEKPFPPRLCPIEPPKPRKERIFVPPQGMDAGQYPKALFYQYYPNKNEGYTFDLLPLPFMDRLKYEEMRALSMDNENLYNKWKDFVCGLPESELEIVPQINKRFWRWKDWIRYMPHENRTDFRNLMDAGPKLDHAGRLPITGEELPTFREYRDSVLRTTDVKNILRKADGQGKLIVKPNFSLRPCDN